MFLSPKMVYGTISCRNTPLSFGKKGDCVKLFCSFITIYMNYCRQPAKLAKKFSHFGSWFFGCSQTKNQIYSYVLPGI